MNWRKEFYNFIGASVRWLYGSIWRTLANKQKFTFHEYLRGPENSDDYFDNYGHAFVNVVIGIITLVALLAVIIRLW